MMRIKFIGEPAREGMITALVTFEPGEHSHTGSEKDESPAGFRFFDVVFNAGARVEIEIPYSMLENLARRAIQNTSKRATRHGIKAKLTSGTPIYTRRERFAQDTRS